MMLPSAARLTGAGVKNQPACEEDTAGWQNREAQSFPRLGRDCILSDDSVSRAG